MTIANAETPRKNCKSGAVLLPLGSEPKVGTNIFFFKNRIGGVDALLPYFAL